MTAQARLSGGTVTDVTNSSRLSWSSSDPGIATADSKGLVTGLKAGTVTITAAGSNAGGQPFSATAQVEVTGALVTGLQVTPATASVPVGFGQAYVATALFSDGSTLDVTHFTGLTWSSSAPGNATISNAAGNKGHATGVTPGTALQITPDPTSVARGWTRQFTAIATFSDGTQGNVTFDQAVHWSGSDTSIATIGSAGSIDSGKATGVNVGSAGSNNGLATAVNAGTTTITASGTNSEGTPVSAAVQMKVRNVTISQIFGVVSGGDLITTFPIGPSRSIDFVCGSIINAMGTPEQGVVGSPEGNPIVTATNVDHVSSMFIEWGSWSGEPNVTSLSKLIIRHSYGAHDFQCGSSFNTTVKGSAEWFPVAGEVFGGFSLATGRFTHAIRFLSVEPIS